MDEARSSSTAGIRDQLNKRLEALKGVRRDYDDEIREIARFAQPARSRFLAGNKDEPGKRRLRNRKLLDSHGIEAFRTLTNGMTSGLSSPSRPWFTLRLPDEDLNEQPGVREWLSDVERRIYAFLSSTNFYGAVKSGYAELGLFGTEACIMMAHRTRGAVCHQLTFGEYWIALDDSLTADTLYRRCPITVRQAMQMFGDSVSNRIRTDYDKGNYTTEVNAYHAIERDSEYDPHRFGSKPYRSVYWDEDDSRDTVLRKSGFDSKPFWAPRWDVVGGDTYGVSPGMEALPALRELQMQNKRRNEAIDQMVKPEMVVPAGLRLTGEPGRKVSGSGVNKESVLVPYEIPYQAVASIGAEIEKCQQQIDALSYADLFNAITNMRGIQPRNMEEIASRNEEKLTQLGPVIERVNSEKLEVAIDRTFEIMSAGNLLPPVPEALAGSPIDIEFVSILSQMQRMVGLGQIEKAAGFAGNAAGAFPDILDNFDSDEMAREYASRAGTPPKIIRPMQKVEEIRAQRAQQQQMQQMAEMAAPAKDGIEAARLLSESDLGTQAPVPAL